MTTTKNIAINTLVFDLNKMVLFKKYDNNHLRQFTHKPMPTYFENMYYVNLASYFEEMIKSNNFNIQSEKHHQFLQELDINTEVTMDNSFLHHIEPVLVHTIKRENEFVLGFMYLNMNRDIYHLHVTYLIRKDNQTYIGTVLLNDENSKCYLREDYTSKEFLNDLYDNFREDLLSIKPHDSYFNFFSQPLIKPILNRICLKKENEQKFKKLIYSLYPFMNKYENVKDYYGAEHEYYPSIMTYLLDEVYFSYKKYLDIPSYKETLSNYNEKELAFLMKETEPLKQVKYFIPKANKHTVKTLKEFFSLNNPATYSEYRENSFIMYMDIFKVFHNQDNLIRFICEIETQNPYEYEDDLGIEIRSTTRIYDTLNYFIRKDLPTIFTSQKKMEQYLIQFLKDASQKIHENIEDFIIEKEEEINEDCDYNEDDPLFPLNLTELNSKLIDLMDVRSHVTLFIEELKQRKTDENLLKIEILEKALNTKTNDIIKSHDLLTEAYHLTSNVQTRFTSIRPQLAKKDKLSMVEILDNYTLRKVGFEMHHCVATYTQRIAKKEVSIFVVRNNETNEYVGCLEYNHRTKAIVQAKAKYNFQIRNKKCLSLIKEFCQLNKFKVETIDLNFKEEK